MTILDGISILQTIEPSLFWSVVCGIIGAILTLIGITVFISWLIDGSGFDIVYLLVVLGTLAIGIPLLFISKNKDDKFKKGPIYKVTVTDDVKFNEFMEKYEIINVEGKIYTVYDKEYVSDEENNNVD